MVIEGVSASEVFGAQQGREHVDRHGDGGGDVDDGDDHGSDPPEQGGEDREESKHRRAERDVDEVHGNQLRILEPPIYRASASRVGGYGRAQT
jgi:hypothetical protein